MNTEHFIIELFCEEAARESATMQSYFEDWQIDKENTGALESLNQSFLNLKGSARLVGADILADYALSIENILVQIIDGGLEATVEVVEFLDYAVPSTSKFIEAYTNEKLPVTAVNDLCHRAFKLATAIYIADSGVAAQSSGIRNDSSVAERQEQLQVFRKEVFLLLEIVDGFLLDPDKNHVNQDLCAAVGQLRACSSKANAKQMAAVAGDMEVFLGQLYASGERCSMEVIQLISEFHLTMQQLLVAGSNFGVDIPNWNMQVINIWNKVKV